MDDPVEVLRKSRRIAVVGASANAEKDAHTIPKHMLDAGYDIIPVNPTAPEVFGRKAYKTLADVPGPIDLVNVFRPASEAPGIVQQAIAAGARGVWLQTGIANAEAAAMAKAAGLLYIEDACVRVVERRLRHLASDL